MSVSAFPNIRFSGGDVMKTCAICGPTKERTYKAYDSKTNTWKRICLSCAYDARHWKQYLLPVDTKRRLLLPDSERMRP